MADKYEYVDSVFFCQKFGIILSLSFAWLAAASPHSFLFNFDFAKKKPTCEQQRDYLDFFFLSFLKSRGYYHTFTCAAFRLYPEGTHFHRI